MQSYYGGDSHVIDDDSIGSTYGISDDAYAVGAVTFSHTMKISIKELQLYTFKKKEPFKKISNNILILHGHSHKCSLKVMRIDIYCRKMRVLFKN